MELGAKRGGKAKLKALSHTEAQRRREKLFLVSLNPGDSASLRETV
jgi:hypothetical protein